MNRKEISQLLANSTFVCQNCSCEFTPTRRTSKFCSRACGDVVRKRKYRKTDKGKEQLKSENLKRVESKREWARSQPSYVHLARCRKYQCQKQSLTPNLSTIELMMIQNYYEDAALLSKQTGIPHEVDHIIPLSKCGWHHPFNLRVVTRDVNRSKGARI
jgi:hypothetical protein